MLVQRRHGSRDRLQAISGADFTNQHLGHQDENTSIIWTVVGYLRDARIRLPKPLESGPRTGHIRKQNPPESTKRTFLRTIKERRKSWPP